MIGVNKSMWSLRKLKCRNNILGLFAVLLLGSIIIINAVNTTHSIANKIVRFHVVANSDSIEDQLLKQRVRDEVIENIRPFIDKCESVEETKSILKDMLPNIKEISLETIQKYGKDYKVYVAFDKANFPTKSYGDVIFPSGEYEACRIIIGEGKGENWWCVMYPPLCYLDAASGVVPIEGKEKLLEELNQEQYNLVTDHSKINYEVRFKVVDMINSVLYRTNYKEKKK